VGLKRFVRREQRSGRRTNPNVANLPIALTMAIPSRDFDEFPKFGKIGRN
jgi:hypothetical protein